MDKKDKKRLEVLKQKIQKLRLQLAGARQQADEPGEEAKILKESQAAEAEIAQIKKDE